MVDAVSVSGVNMINVQGMDLETAMMAVQTNRANLLETQQKDQIASVQAKNDMIAKLNQALGMLNKAAALFPSDAKAGDTMNGKANGFSSSDWQLEKEVNQALQTAGVRPFTQQGSDVTSGQGRVLDGTTYTGGIGGGTNKGQLDGAIQQLKSQIDAASNTQQMDMLRLQSISNKRNEAFDVMTNFIKKMQESRSSIVGNMR